MISILIIINKWLRNNNYNRKSDCIAKPVTVTMAARNEKKKKKIIFTLGILLFFLRTFESF